ncbi:MAG: HAMP domain-containing protein [Deltaproteobacteria bacterium]|nr:HAMP domain-containing protein [Deltaproteobacteria bacterium]
MNLQSLKTRFIGSYLFLLILFIIQIPIIYVLIGGMSEKYAQVETAGSLRKRAVEIAEILNRHVMTGNEELEKTFQQKKAEFGEVIEGIKKGTDGSAAITNAAMLEKLGLLEKEWVEMRSALDKAMEAGDGLRVAKAEVEDTTFPMVEKLNELITVLDGKYVNMAGLERMRTVKLSYLFERYIISYQDKELVSNELRQTISELDSTLAVLKGIKGDRLAALESMWAVRKNSLTSGIQINDSYQSQMHALVDNFTPKIVGAANELTKTIAAEARSAAMRGLAILSISALICGAFAVFFMWIANDHMIKPIIKIKQTVEDFASGDLTKRAEIKLKFLGMDLRDEVAALGDSVDAMAEQMSGVIGRITDSSNHLASASEELSSSSTQIEEGADRQSGQTAQVATAMEEMNATVIEVAKNSQQASESARAAQRIAANGGEVVNLAITAMQEVAESTSITSDTVKNLGKRSEEIGTIVSVINDIADQTNLLALNAAIEAARAGEQGRGFAVVADEVRRLAERTSKATKEISDMIKAIQEETGKAVVAMRSGTEKVENGVKLANEAGEALHQIVSGVENVTEMIAHIATSAEEQSATTDEIAQNMDSIAAVSKANVSTIAEVSHATNDLARLASELKELVSNFNISKDNKGELKANDGNQPEYRKPYLIKDSNKEINPRHLSVYNAK